MPAVASSAQPQFETPPKITISVTNTCNLDCRHCYGRCSRTPAGEELGTFDVPVAMRVLELAQQHIEAAEAEIA